LGRQPGEGNLKLRLLFGMFQKSRNFQTLMLMVYQDDKINPSTYKTLDQPGYWGVHAIGEVWAEILWVVLQT
jgi:hypothetical protein